MKRFLLLFFSLLLPLARGADNILFPGVVQNAAQNHLAPLAATDNGDGTWSLKVALASAVNASTTAASPTQGVKAVAAAGTPVVLTGSGAVLVESVEIHARKNVTTANTGAVYVGFSSTGGQNYRVLLPGEAWSLTATAGKKLDLHLIYIDAATNADAVTWTALN